jgi:hypothetical protein
MENCQATQIQPHPQPYFSQQEVDIFLWVVILSNHPKKFPCSTTLHDYNHPSLKHLTEARMGVSIKNFFHPSPQGRVKPIFEGGEGGEEEGGCVVSIKKIWSQRGRGGEKQYLYSNENRTWTCRFLIPGNIKLCYVYPAVIDTEFQKYMVQSGDFYLGC